MKQDICLTLLCEHYQLAPVVECRRMEGSYQHQLWYLKTVESKYVIKAVQDINFWNLKTKNDYEMTETLAEMMKQEGIPTIAALDVDGDYVFQFQTEKYLIYPYVEGTPILSHFNHQQLITVAQTLARMHRCKIEESFLSPRYPVDIHQHSWCEILQDVRSKKQVWHDLISDHLVQLEKWTNNFLTYQYLYDTQKVFSHRDFNGFNLLWKDNQLTVVDWEGVGLHNQAIDILGMLVNCSGIIDDHFEEKSIDIMLSAYQEINKLPVMDEKIIQAGLGTWLSWLHFCLRRSLFIDDVSDEKFLQDIHLTFSVLNFLEKNLKDLSGLLTNY